MNMTNFDSKTGKSQNFQVIIAKAMRQSSNNNVMGDTSFAEMQAKREETFKHLYDVVLAASNIEQAQRLTDIVKLALRDSKLVDDCSAMAMGDVMGYARYKAREAIKDVRKARAGDPVDPAIDLDLARAEQHCEDMLNVYWMVKEAFYTSYKRIMAEYKTTTFKSKVS
jgi:hypothetical protein